MSKQLQRQLLAKARRVSRAIEAEKKTVNDLAAAIRTASDGFLVSAEWKELRQRVLDRYGWRCMCCGSVPKKRHRVNVDHIKPRLLFPELALDFDNLQVLCSRCNKFKGNTTRDYRPLGKL